ncbi:MAG: hypothetical protein A3J40_10190 [Erythrobacter sp. RIFCSPHIGHO2_12_FULL_63_10]|nr:MAG: hypothetical protein A3J40_10190 [Erythrobacter sp. RIFCSPHIGHO2_12_FULL_63_10]
MSRSLKEFAQLQQIDPIDHLHRARTANGNGEAPKVGVIYNPRSHRNKGQDLDCDFSPQIFVAQPGDRQQLPLALADFAQRGIDLLVINGGDGTVRDVLTCGAGIFGDDWPAIAVLPKGKTNALTVDLEAPSDWSLQAAIDAFQHGRIIRRRPIRISSPQDPGIGVLGFVLGAGAFTMATRAGQSAHRLGAFNSLAVAITTLWVVLQVIFGTDRNPWRRGARMNLFVGKALAPFQHSGIGDPAYRRFLLASTLERFPAGMKPFGALGPGLKLAVLDQAPRRSMLLLPAIIMGRSLRNLRERGIHQVSPGAFELEIDDQIILDGEAFPAGRYRIETGPELEFVAP